MEFLDIAQKRYTTKKYNPTLQIEQETIEKLKKLFNFHHLLLIANLGK